jgi:proline iminopeptidase
MATFEHDGCSMWFESLGEGPPLMLLHGGLGLDHTYFRPWLDPLAAEHAVVFFDFRANGRSSGDGQDLTLKQLADDVDALRSHLGFDRVSLLGHSYGGFVALEYALTHPEHLDRLVLCDTDSGPPAEETIGGELHRLGAGDDVMAAFGQPVETTEDMLAFFDVVGRFYLPHSQPDIAGQVLGDTIFRREGSEGGSAALSEWDVSGRLGEVAAPTLVLTGVDDFMFPPARAELLQRGIAGAQLTVMDGSGHLPFVEQPADFLSAVGKFLSA